MIDNNYHSKRGGPGLLKDSYHTHVTFLAGSMNGSRAIIRSVVDIGSRRHQVLHHREVTHQDPVHTRTARMERGRGRNRPRES